MTLRRAGQKRGVVLLTRSKEDECPSVSLDLSCDSSSFDSDDCATRAEKVSDLELPHIFGVSPWNYDNVSGGGVCHTMLHKKNLYWNGQLVWTPALALYLCVGDRGPGTGDCVQRDLSPTSGYTGIFARRRYANFFYLQSVPTRSLSTLVG